MHMIFKSALSTPSGLENVAYKKSSKNGRFTYSYGAGTKFKRNTGLYGTSVHSQLATIQKICPKAI